MKSISVREPWASLIRSGDKTIETRTWNTKHRGSLLICTSQKPKTEFSGMAIAVVDVVDCKDMVKSDEKRSCCEIYPKAKSWFLENIRKVKPFPVKGKLSLFETDEELIVYER